MIATPADIAREALRQLATRRVPPTPDNYCTLYSAIAANEGGVAPAWEAPGVLPCPERAPALQALLGQLLEAVLCLVSRSPTLAEDVGAAARSARYTASGELARGLLTRVQDLLPRLRRAAAENEQLQDGLVRLLQRLTGIARDTAVDDATVSGVVAALEQLTTRVDAASIDEAEQRIAALAARHDAVKHGLEEIRNALKEIAARLIDRLACWSVDAGDRHDRLARYAEQIAGTNDVPALNAVLQDVLRETRAVQADALATQEALIAARREAEAAHERIRSLETDLVQAHRRVREDSLTGMVNRYGVEHDFEREAERADRVGQPLSLALIDIDDFKRFNDLYGHQGGDKALVYLSGIMTQNARRGDTVSRFGGEEFLLLLPNTRLEEARTLVARLQHALTRHLFLHKNDQVLITFSCGVAQRRPGESREALIERVDKALYRAKREGKNRICTAR